MKHLACLLPLPALALGGCGNEAAFGGGSLKTSPAVEIRVLSNRADLVSGGDALVEVVLPAGADVTALKVDVAGRDVSDQFALRADGRVMGVVTDIAEGESVLKATAAGAGSARIALTNHPLGGPIFSGQQIQPWYCLPGALDAQCSRPVSYEYWYRSEDALACTIAAQSPQQTCFLTYDPASPPAAVATTTTDQGQTVPYIVRVETGNMDRNQYRIAVLADPAVPFDRWTGPPAWNHKVFMPHGAGCSTSHAEGPAPGVLLDIALSRGFAVMSTALSDNAWSCNPVVQAESVMMAKERLIEAYGDVRYLFGAGCSGGSIASLTMANAYPGLYDGLIVACTMPDAPINDLVDCRLLLDYWLNPTAWAPGVVWTELQEAAASGFASTSVCLTWVQVFHYPELFQPRTGVGCRVPENEPDQVYNADTNPEGVRCSLQDHWVNQLGTRPPERWGAAEQQIGRGFANRPFDNVGVQYGLRALESGAISVAQFVDLNAKIGGVDIDYNHQPARIDADPDALGRAYRSGLSNQATHLDRIAIIDIPGWSPADRYEIHDNAKSWGLRARLDAAIGGHDNHVLWFGPDQPGNVTRTGANIMGDVEAFETLDQWLAAVEADARDLPRARKVADDKPELAHDRCSWPAQETCDLLFTPAGNPRYGAGMKTLANDIIKCRLKPLVREDYGVTFSDAQWEQLQQAFPSGVCDYELPGVDQQPTAAWMTYAQGPAGQPLPAPPVSQSD